MTARSGAAGAGAPGPAARDDIDEIVGFWQAENSALDPVTKQVSMRLRRGAQAIERGLRRNLAETGVDETWEIDVLLALRRTDGHACCVGELVREARVTSGAMTNRVDRLEQRGWVTREPDPADRRQVRVRLTDAGLARADHIIAAKTQLEARIFAGVDRSVLDRLADDLRTVLLAMERAVDRDDRAVPTP